jgi:hypothetical protein
MHLKIRLSVILTLVLALALPLVALAQRVELLPPVAGDLTAERLYASPGLKSALPAAAPDLERQPLAFAWPVDAQAELAASRPFVAESREFWFQVDGRELAAGVILPVTAPAAVVRVNPLPGSAAARPLAAASLSLIDAGGELHRGSSGMEQLATAEQLRAAGAAFPEGTVAFRIAERLGAGDFVLRAAADAVTPQARYVIHVLDRGSAVLLRLSTDQTAYLHGGRLVVKAAMTDAGRALALDEITAFVTSPAGRGWPVVLRPAGDGSYRGSLTLDGSGEAAARGDGLWEVQVSASGERGGQTLARAARTAFSAAAPTARWLGAAPAAAGERGSLAVRFEIETATAGRYEVRGVLYGSDRSGELRPAAVAHAAAWLEAGQGGLTLAFDPAFASAAGLSAPFEIRDLRLIDQGRMGLLQRQERGVVIVP